MNSSQKADNNKFIVPEKSAVRISKKCAEVTATLEELNKLHTSLLDTNLASALYINSMNKHIAKFDNKKQ